jgi:teichoic acid transport system permease protein
MSELWHRREFAWYLAMGNIRARNARTTLGLLWWVLGPLMLGMIFLLVFGIILDTRRGDPNYLGWLLTGLFGFYYTRSVMATGAQSILGNSDLVATQRFPRLLLPISATIEGAFGFLFSLIPLYAITGFGNGDWPTWNTLIHFPPAFFFQTLFTLGLASIIAMLTVPIRDIANLLPYLTRVWLYLSPVLFSIEARVDDPGMRTLLNLNPMAAILGWHRHALQGRELLPYHVWGTIAWSLGLLVIGVTLFVRTEHKLARHL